MFHSEQRVLSLDARATYMSQFRVYQRQEESDSNFLNNNMPIPSPQVWWETVIKQNFLSIQINSSWQWEKQKR